MNLANLFRQKKAKKPRVSVIASAIRTNLWKEVYKNLEDNKTPLEIIFVGPNKPNFKLPQNFRYFHSRVKPMQCVEIAARKARGEFIVITGDDCLFSKRAIDRMVEIFENIKDDKIIVSGMWFKNGKEQGKEKHHYIIGDNSSPLFPYGGLMKKIYWKQLGGLDKRFIVACGDIDLFLRFYEIGGRVILTKKVFCNERKNKCEGEHLYPEFGQNKDRPLLDSFWMKNGKVSKKRLTAFKPFSPKGIRLKSQGPKGRWV